ncbi:MAG: response regulator [Nanoarchaeota archaeon]
MGSVLMVDDEPLKIKYYREALDEAGFEVTYHPTVDGADRFLDEAMKKSQAPDAITLDMGMPCGFIFTPKETGDCMQTGLALYRRMREVHHYTGPVVVLTFLALPDVQAYFQKQPNCVLTSPVETKPDDLVAIIQRMCAPGSSLARDSS